MIQTKTQIIYRKRRNIVEFSDNLELLQGHQQKEAMHCPVHLGLVRLALAVRCVRSTAGHNVQAQKMHPM